VRVHAATIEDELDCVDSCRVDFDATPGKRGSPADDDGRDRSDSGSHAGLLRSPAPALFRLLASGCVVALNCAVQAAAKSSDDARATPVPHLTSECADAAASAARLSLSSTTSSSSSSSTGTHCLCRTPRRQWNFWVQTPVSVSSLLTVTHRV
jgi:hypothetical protein